MEIVCDLSWLGNKGISNRVALHLVAGRLQHDSFFHASYCTLMHAYAHASPTQFGSEITDTSEERNKPEKKSYHISRILLVQKAQDTSLPMCTRYQQLVGQVSARDCRAAMGNVGICCDDHFPLLHATAT